MQTVYMAKDAKRLLDQGEEIILPVAATPIIKDWFLKQAGYVDSAKSVTLTSTNGVACAAMTNTDDLIEYALKKGLTARLHKAKLKSSKDEKYNKEAYIHKDVYYIKITKPV